MAKKISFDKAQEELESILSQLQNEDVSIDKLSDKLKRAKELVQICKSKLRTIEEEIASINKDE